MYNEAIPRDLLAISSKTNRYTHPNVIVSSFFRKFNFCHLVSGSQPAMISDSSSSSGLER